MADELEVFRTGWAAHHLASTGADRWAVPRAMDDARGAPQPIRCLRLGVLVRAADRSARGALRKMAASVDHVRPAALLGAAAFRLEDLVVS